MKFSQYTNDSVENSQYMKWEEGENQIRIVSEPVICYKRFKDAENENVKVYLTKVEAMKDKKAKERSMFWAINRKTGKAQLVEAGPQIMEQIKMLATTGDSKFEDLPPYDIYINKKGSGIDTEYAVVAARSNVPLTPDEEEAVKGLKSVFDLLCDDALDAEAAKMDRFMSI